MRDDNKILARPSQPSPIPLLVFGWQPLQVATVRPCASLVCERESLAGPLRERMSARARICVCGCVGVLCVRSVDRILLNVQRGPHTQLTPAGGWQVPDDSIDRKELPVLLSQAHLHRSTECRR